MYYKILTSSMQDISAIRKYTSTVYHFNSNIPFNQSVSSDRYYIIHTPSSSTTELAELQKIASNSVVISMGISIDTIQNLRKTFLLDPRMSDNNVFLMNNRD
jgi:hypothetical protein